MDDLGSDPFDVSDLPWPKRGDDPFRPRTPVSMPAILESGPHAWGAFAAGFRFSAQTLVERFQRTGYDQDFLALPVMFMYRHYAELSLKDLIFECGSFLGRPTDVADEHDLRRLWVIAREFLEALNLAGPDADAVEELLNRLGAADPKSMTFRYPVDKKGRPMLPPKLQRFDLLHFSRQMEGFAGWVDGTSAMVEQAREFEAEYGDSFP